MSASWEIRVEVHGPPPREVVWRGEAPNREEAVSRALAYTERQLGRLRSTVGMTLSVVKAPAES